MAHGYKFRKVLEEQSVTREPCIGLRG